MKYFYGLAILCTLIVAIDISVAYISDWRQRRQRERAARKYGMAPGAFKPVSKHWWAS